MKNVRMAGIALVALAFLMTTALVLVAAANERESQTIPAEGAKTASLDLTFSAGKLFISPRDIADFAQIEINRDPTRIEETFEHKLNGSVIDVTMESRPKSHTHNLDTDKNEWDMNLSTRYPTEARIEVGACAIDAEFGGIPITEFTLNVGAASGDISFSEPNRERIREMTIEAGASSLKLHDLGNARFDNLKFEGGAGKFVLDFRGQCEGESEVSIEVGLGAADIILPQGVPVRIEADEDNWFSSVDIRDRHSLHKIDDGIWESSGYDDARTRIRLKIDVGMGSIDVRFKP